MEPLRALLEKYSRPGGFPWTLAAALVAISIAFISLDVIIRPESTQATRLGSSLSAIAALGTAGVAIKIFALSTQKARESQALQRIAIAVSKATGEEFLDTLVRELAQTLRATGAYISRLNPEQGQAQTLAAFAEGEHLQTRGYPILDNIDGQALREATCQINHGLKNWFPHDPWVLTLDAEACAVQRLDDSQGKPLGVLGVVFDSPVLTMAHVDTVLKLFAIRAAAELERINAETHLHTVNQQLEERVQERTLELQTANKELEAFCYSVAHDLRGPLRALDGFSLAVIEDYGHMLPEEGHGHLNRVRAATRRMDEIIDAMLGLSRLSRMEMTKETVDLSQLAQAAIEDLQNEHPEQKVEVEIQPNLTAQGDPRLLQTALENLLSNAWKFTTPQPNPKITFKKQGKEFVIEDNGVGFDETYKSKLFQPFERLHDAKQFPGSGVGLATVQRIIHRHGGEIKATGKEGQGATFKFTL